MSLLTTIPIVVNHEHSKPIGEVHFNLEEAQKQGIKLTDMILTAGWKVGDDVPMAYGLVPTPDILNPDKRGDLITISKLEHKELLSCKALVEARDDADKADPGGCC